MATHPSVLAWRILWTDSRAAPGKSGLHARGEGERVLALESREGSRAWRRVEDGLSIFASCGQIIGVSASALVLPMNIQD